MNGLTIILGFLKGLKPVVPFIMIPFLIWLAIAGLNLTKNGISAVGGGIKSAWQHLEQEAREDLERDIERQRQYRENNPKSVAFTLAPGKNRVVPTNGRSFSIKADQTILVAVHEENLQYSLGGEISYRWTRLEAGPPLLTDPTKFKDFDALEFLAPETGPEIKVLVKFGN